MASVNKVLGRKETKKDTKKIIDMRGFVQDQLDLWDLGKIVAVVGPQVKNGDDYYELVVKYRPPGNENARDVQFYDKRIEINIGYTRKGGYWNRRCIRLAIQEEGKEAREAKRAEVVWANMPRELTTGKNKDGAFEL